MVDLLFSCWGFWQLRLLLCMPANIFVQFGWREFVSLVLICGFLLDAVCVFDRSGYSVLLLIGWVGVLFCLFRDFHFVLWWVAIFTFSPFLISGWSPNFIFWLSCDCGLCFFDTRAAALSRTFLKFVCVVKSGRSFNSLSLINIVSYNIGVCVYWAFLKGFKSVASIVSAPDHCTQWIQDETISIPRL